MVTISDIIMDIDRGCVVHNLQENCFAYRLIYFVNENGIGKKYYVDSKYDGLRAALENIIRGNLSTTNNIVFAAITTRRNGETVSLLSGPYSFSLSGYFQQICGEKGKESISSNYGRGRANWG